MKPQLLLSLLLAALLPMTASAQSGEGEFPDLFNTSAAYDMLAVFPQADKLAEDPFFTGTLGADTLFLDRAHRIDSVVRPSQLCNLYSLSRGSKDDPEQVVEFFASFDPESLPQKVRGAWIDEICSVRDELSYCLQRLAQAGYAQYWQEQVRPCLNNAIEQYRIAPEQLGAIHQEITRLAGGQPLDATGSRIYILGNIDNAFALLDETFCCTPLLLDPETARQYRIDFMQVYIHENLHRLSLSGELLDMLQTLYDNDDFYRTHEDRARAYGEGGNEAFVVAGRTVCIPPPGAHRRQAGIGRISRLLRRHARIGANRLPLSARPAGRRVLRRLSPPAVRPPHPAGQSRKPIPPGYEKTRRNPEIRTNGGGNPVPNPKSVTPCCCTTNSNPTV